MDFANKRVTVMGLGTFGGQIAVIHFLARQHAREIIVTDSKPADKLADSVAQIADVANVTLRLGGHVESDFVDVDAVVVSPAVPRNSPLLAAARAAGVVVTSEMNLFFERCRAPIVGITGSAGKSTTTAMIECVLSSFSRDSQGSASADRTVHTGGNIGHRALLPRVDQIAAHDIVVLELSSFQLSDLAAIQRSPHVAVVTNIAPNHLDWHGSMSAYVHAKQNILRFQSADDIAILNAEDESLSGRAETGRAGPSSTADMRAAPSSGPAWSDITPARTIWYSAANAAGLPLKVVGRHNKLNAAAAQAVGRALGLPDAAIADALSRFAALPNRLELVAVRDSVRWFNDSKSTTPESTLTAMAAFDEEHALAIVIVGGYDKKIDLEPLCHELAMRAKAVITIGQTGGAMAELVRRHRVRGSGLGVVQSAGDLESAVKVAAGFASPGDVVLLSPASASYDQFANYEQRGQRFRELVAEL